MIITAVNSFLGSTLVSLGFILRFRSICEQDKPFAAGLGVTIHGLFSAIPSPMIFGAIADAACSIWQESCKKTGNCWLYDADKFRLYFHGGALFFWFLSYACDVLIFHYSKSLKNIYDDEVDTTEDHGSVGQEIEESKL